MMLISRYGCKRLLTILLSMTVLISGSSFLAFASEGDNVTFKELSLNSKTTITFNKSLDDKYYKFTVPKTGKYIMYIYSSYNDDSKNDFWFGVYKTRKDALNMENLIDNEIGLVNSDTPDPDYEIRTLRKGAYYIHAQAFHAKRNKTALKIREATDADLYEVSLDGHYYAGEDGFPVNVGYYDNTKDKFYEGKVRSVRSGNSNVVKISKEKVYDSKNKSHYIYNAEFRKPGRSKITVKYKLPDGTKAVAARTVTVEKYPKQIKSLSINGKAINTNKNKYSYNLSKYKKTSATLKLKLKDGWKIANADAYRFRSDSDSNQHSRLSRKTILRGKNISFPKKYDSMIVSVTMENKEGRLISFNLVIER